MTTSEVADDPEERERRDEREAERRRLGAHAEAIEEREQQHPQEVRVTLDALEAWVEHEAVPAREAIFEEPAAWRARIARFPRLALRDDQADLQMGIFPPERVDRDLNRLRSLLHGTPSTLILCDNEGQLERMEELLGPLHRESYVHVHDVRADAYGFGGLTQERRYIARKLWVPPYQLAV